MTSVFFFTEPSVDLLPWLQPCSLGFLPQSRGRASSSSRVWGLWAPVPGSAPEEDKCWRSTWRLCLHRDRPGRQHLAPVASAYRRPSLRKVWNIKRRNPLTCCVFVLPCVSLGWRNTHGQRGEGWFQKGGVNFLKIVRRLGVKYFRAGSEENTKFTTGFPKPKCQLIFQSGNMTVNFNSTNCVLNAYSAENTRNVCRKSCWKVCN